MEIGSYRLIVDDRDDDDEQDVILMCGEAWLDAQLIGHLFQHKYGTCYSKSLINISWGSRVPNCVQDGFGVLVLIDHQSATWAKWYISKALHH